jgi:hypothetical protein
MFRRERIDMRVQRFAGQRFQRPAQMDRDIVPGRHLVGHLVMFGFVYPSERDKIPKIVMDALMAQLAREQESAPPPGRLCQGTLISRAQFQVDIDKWGYEDARMDPNVRMTDEHIAQWTDAIADEIRTYGCDQRNGSARGGR